MGDHERRFRYGRWQGGPDPLAPPYDVGSVLDELGRDVLAGGSVQEALRDLLRRGPGDRRGLDDLTERVRRMREQRRRQGRLGGTLDEARAALDQALAAERDALAAADDEQARWSEMELNTLPDDIAGAIRGLAGYAWRSEQARSTYQEILQRLQTEALDAQFAGMKQALEGDPQAMAAVKEMLTDLNALLAAHARGEDTTDRFREFMAKHGHLFPEDPRNVEELIEALARRQAATERMLASMSPEQREQIAQLMSDALGDLDLAAQMAQLSDNLRALRPGMFGRGPVEAPSGDSPLGYAEGVAAVAYLADVEALERALGQDYPGSSLDDVDVAALEQHLGSGAAADFEGLRRLERELERQGFVDRADDGLRLTPRAVRRLGETALRRVFARLESTGKGDHLQYRPGGADEPTGTTRQWAFGDELPLDAARTVGNAVRRHAMAGSPVSSRPSGVGGTQPGPVRLRAEDFEVVETQRRTTAAVALCVDLSFSMLYEGRWGSMKQTALALSHLIATRYRQDALQIIGFDLSARRLTPVQLAAVEPEWVQGTNLQHALMIATRHLRRHPDAEPVVLVVTDGEPTAHLQADGTPTFMWPTTSETLRATIRQVDDLTRYGAALNFFMLGDDPGLARFVDAVAQRAGGRVFTPDLGRLGEYVVADYLRARQGRG